MANLQQVLAYLQQHRTKYPIATLKAGLLKQGVPEALIEQAISSLSGTTPTPPPPTQPPGAPTQRTPVPGQPGQPPTQPPAQRPPAQQFPFRTPTQIGLPGQRLPVPGQPPAQAPAPIPVPTQPPAPAGKPGRTYALVVDDDALIRDMLVAKLEGAGYRVTCAEDAAQSVIQAEGMKLLEGAGYRVTCAEDAAQSVIQAEGMKLSLIVSDIEMPGFGTGVDALKKLRASSFVRRDMPVIFVTGMPPHEAQKIVPKTDPYLRLMHKPVDWRLMRQYIKELTGMDNPLD
ncbi:MAG: response regulator [Elusimicrobia bacterium]|nr:response regulator [Elusimicrobiota bacterium]